MVRFESTENKDQRICIVFEGHFDNEDLLQLRKGITQAVKGLTSNKESAGMYDDAIYWLCELLEQSEFTYEQGLNVAICEQLNKERIDKLLEILVKRHWNKGLTAEEREIEKVWIKD